MTYLPENPGVVSTLNSSIATLAGGAVFTGAAEDVSAYSMLTVLVHSDVAGATKGISLELSMDGVNWDRTKTVTANVNDNQTAFGGVHTLAIVSQYFRIVYTNGVLPQTVFRLQTIYHKHKSKHLTSSLDQDINDQADVELVRAALMGQTTGGTFTSVGVDNQGYLKTSVTAPKTAFGDLAVNTSQPTVQLDSVYGLLDSDVEVFFSGAGSSVSGATREFVLQNGTTLGGYGTLRSKRTVRYRPGQGVIVRLTTLFDQAAVALSTQLAGAFVAENGLFFGYDGTDFGIMRQTGGASEIQTLTITAADGTGGNADVTIDGVLNTVALTGGGTVQDDAAEIAAFSYTGWDARQVDDTVIFFATSGVGNKTGSFTYAAPVDGTGTFAETKAGAANTDTWVAQTAWNVDTLDGSGDSSNRSGMLLDTSKLNIYTIQFQWLGAGPINYFVTSQVDGIPILVHIDEYANNYTVASLQDPSLKVGWAVASLGATGTNLTVKGLSAAGFVEGPILPRRNPRGISNSKINIGDTYTSILAIRTGLTFNGFTSQKELLPLDISASVDGTKISDIAVFLNPTIAGTPNWQYIDEGNSIAELDIAGTTVTNGEELIAVSLGKTGSNIINLREYSLKLEAGDVLVVAARTASGTTDASASFSWVED